MFAYCNNSPTCLADTSGCIPVSLINQCGYASSGKSAVGAAPAYVEIGESDGNRSTNPNCYSYAMGIYTQSYDPGDFSKPFRSLSVNSVAEAVESDFNELGRGCRRINSCHSSINSNEYRIALRVSPIYYSEVNGAWQIVDWDYHFMVQTETGCWAEKHGPGGATVYHSTGTPDTISWDCGSVKGFYSSEIIYFAITN